MADARPAAADAYPGNETVVGNVRSATVRQGESLIEIAREYGLGYNQIVAANPHLDPFVPGAGVTVAIPTSWIVPHATPVGTVVINLSEFRLYYRFKVHWTTLLVTFPIGIGREGNETPIGTFRIIEKLERPTWYVPQSIKQENPELPDQVPPGPDNPLGSHAMRLSLPSILIHGTNKPWAVGRMASHGCIRLYPEDIPQLFRLVAVGTKVQIVREPIKVGVRAGKVFLEVHQDTSYRGDFLEEAVRLVGRKGMLLEVGIDRIVRAVNEKRGYPVDITRLPKEGE